MILAADFGGASIKLGLVRENRVVARSRLETRPEYSFADTLEAVATEWGSLLKSQGLTLADIAGAGLALPFLINVETQRVEGKFEKFPGAAAMDFKSWSRSRLGFPVALENDLRAALLGEQAAGAARGKTDVVMLAFGTGIGCAAMVGGRLLRGAKNRAAALMGHSTIAYDRPVGRCGNIGCAEDLASTATLSRLATAQPEYAASKLAGVAKIDYKIIFTFAAQGDVCAQSILRKSLSVWSVLVQNAVIAYDPEMVVLGGAILRSHEVILPAVREHLRRHMPSLALEIPIVVSALGDDAALIGCAVMAGQPGSISTL
ncbi:MAG TPA: ROK family protein [Verrucomicrobiae bacterium]|nr:ROK family protein [Verrucomicrobiae bacterium]